MKVNIVEAFIPVSPYGWSVLIINIRSVNFFSLQPHAVRVTVKSETANAQFPLLFVARLQRGVMSWPIPDER